MKTILISLFLLVIVDSSFSQIKSIDVNSLAALMEGWYSTSEQSESDSSYRDLRLRIKRIWTSRSHDRSDPQWLYSEISDSSSPEPFRQMICKLSHTNEGRFEQSFFKFANDPLSFSGEWKKENPFAELTEDSLQMIRGCNVILTLMNDDSYEGGTYGTDCKSEVAGAEYSISDIRISNEGLIIKERAFDKNGVQIWGNTNGGYIFKRIK